MSRFQVLYINSDSEDEYNSDDYSEDEYYNMRSEFNKRIELYRKINGNGGITEIDLSNVTITEIKMLNYAYPSDWEGKLSNGKCFYSRYRGGKFTFYVYNKDHKFNMITDTPLIQLYEDDDKNLEDAIEDYVLSESNMLKLCNLTLSEDCIRLDE